MKADFHCHTNCSDGDLNPRELIERAKQNELQALAITDHDSLDAYAQLMQANPLDETACNAESDSPLKLFSGIEFSCQFASQEIHIVGLGFSLENPVLGELIQAQTERRRERAQKIAHKLEKKGLENALEKVSAYVGGGMIARPHFAKLLIAEGMARNHKQAFDRYLGQGKSCYQSTDWPDIAEAVEKIEAAGGISVLAHPTRYKMTASKLRRLVTYFAESGGSALEFVGGAGSKDKQAFLRSLCEEHQLLASPASDFHSDQQAWAVLGRCGDIPEALPKVWQQLDVPVMVF